MAGEQLGPLVILATFDLDVFRQQLGRVGHKGAHGGLLVFEPEPGGTLLLGGDSIIRSIPFGRGSTHRSERKIRRKIGPLCVTNERVYKT